MEYHIGQIFEHDYEPEAAAWCNAHNAVMVEIEPFNDARRFQIQAVRVPAISEMQALCRAVRDSHLRRYVDASAGNCLRWAECTEAEKAEIAAYRRYLLDYPQSGADWWEEEPMTFEEWREGAAESTEDAQ